MRVFHRDEPYKMGIGHSFRANSRHILGMSMFVIALYAKGRRRQKSVGSDNIEFPLGRRVFGELV